MPFLQFVSGSRDQEFAELNAGASLVLGSSSDAHIKLSDPGVEGKHCTVYPAQDAFWLQDMGVGSTVLKMKHLKNATGGLSNGDVFIVGTTYVKFWTKKPEGSGGGGGADPAALERAEKDLAAARAEIDALKGASSGASTRLAETETALKDAKASAESTATDLATAKQDLETSTQNLTATRQDLETTKQDLETSKQDLEASKQSAEEAQTRIATLEGDLTVARAQAESDLAKAKERADAERAEVESALDATREAIAGLEAQDAARSQDSLAAAAGPSDLHAALDALSLPDSLRGRVDAAVRAEIDREVLCRLEGPVVPLRGLRVPGLDRDLETEIRAVRRRGEQIETARKAGLQDLEADELERLLALAKA